MKTLDEVKPLRWHLTHEYHVKYAKSKNDPIKITKFATHDQAKEFLADVEKDGMKGIISWRGRPVKEEVEMAMNPSWHLKTILVVLKCGAVKD